MTRGLVEHTLHLEWPRKEQFRPGDTKPIDAVEKGTLVWNMTTNAEQRICIADHCAWPSDNEIHGPVKLRRSRDLHGQKGHKHVARERLPI